jgi:carboxyl-terminal processing protease
MGLCFGAHRICLAEPPESKKEVIALDVRYASFDYVWNTIHEKHWDPKMGGLDWNAVRDEFRPRVEKAEDAVAFDQLLNEMLARLKQSHTGVIPAKSYKAATMEPSPKSETSKGETPSSSDAKPSLGESDKSTPTASDKNKDDMPSSNLPGADGSIGLELRIVDNRAVVWHIDESFPAYKQGVRLGWILERAGDVAVDEKLRSLSNAKVDESTATLLKILFVEKLCEGEVGQSTLFTWLDGQDQVVETNLTFEKTRGKKIVMGNMPPFQLRVESKMVDKEIPLFRFNCFFDPALVLGAFEELVDENLNAPGLIIDLRGNVGGIGVMAMSIAGWISDRPTQSLGTMTTRGGKMSFTVQPRETIFRGKVAVLVDELSLSTSEILAGGLKDLGHAKIIGRKTPGSALPSIVERLPHGAGFQYPIADYQSYSGERLEGIGVTPNQETVLTREALLAGIDQDVEAAVQWIRNPD